MTVYRMDKDFPGGADGCLVEMAAEDMACLVAKGGVDMEIDLSVHFRNIAHDRGDFQHTGKLVGIEFLFLGVKYADNGRPVRRLAVISGAGGSLFEEALAVGADCLLTGEASHHAAIDAARLGLGLIAAGHYATEYPAVAALAARLQEAVPGLAVFASRENRDPFTYL